MGGSSVAARTAAIDRMVDLELWAAPASTVLAMGADGFDRVRRTGHHDRLDDVERLAALGARRVRFPVLWSCIAGEGRDDWRWSDVRLGRLAELDVAAIATLLDGCGPHDVVAALAAHAGAAVRRYPWLEDWTPIQAPQSTARRTSDGAARLRSLVLSARAIAAAMERIRMVTPHARLVHCDGLGRVLATPALARQCALADDMRWLVLDLLCGRVDRRHPLRAPLEDAGVAASELDALVDRPCPPDVIGIEYDLASDRFLDDRIERHPAHALRTDGTLVVADVEAIRDPLVAIAGHRGVLDDAWARYGRPLAITDTHLGGAREAQLRWLWEAWCAAVDARRDGLDVRAVTISSAFGIAHVDGARYESGAYDVRSKTPRPTAIASLARELADGRTPSHPSLSTPGFWRRDARTSVGGRPVVIAGGTRLADRFAERCEARNIAVVRMPRIDRGAASLPSEPWAVVALHDGPAPARRSQSEVLALLALARECEQRGVHLTTLSNDLVFDGTATRPYVESDPAAPLTVAGRLRRRLERRIQAFAPGALIVRVGPLLDPADPECPLARVLAALVDGSRVRLPDDEVVSPTFVPELVDAALDLIVDGMQGIWHATNGGALSLHELARAAARLAGVSTASLEVGASLHPWGAEVGPGMRALASERASTMSAIDTALATYVASMDPPLASPRPRATTAA